MYPGKATNIISVHIEGDFGRGLVPDHDVVHWISERRAEGRDPPQRKRNEHDPDREHARVHKVADKAVFFAGDMWRSYPRTSRHAARSAQYPNATTKSAPPTATGRSSLKIATNAQTASVTPTTVPVVERN